MSEQKIDSALAFSLMRENLIPFSLFKSEEATLSELHSAYSETLLKIEHKHDKERFQIAMLYSREIREAKMECEKYKSLAISRRLEFTDKTKKELKDELERVTGGSCPICESPILLDGKFYGECDHAVSAGSNSIQDGWCICKKCHSDKTKGGDNIWWMISFVEYKMTAKQIMPSQADLYLVVDNADQD